MFCTLIITKYRNSVRPLVYVPSTTLFPNFAYKVADLEGGMGSQPSVMARDFTIQKILRAIFGDDLFSFLINFFGWKKRHLSW